MKFKVVFSQVSYRESRLYSKVILEAEQLDTKNPGILEMTLNVPTGETIEIGVGTILEIDY